MRPARLACPTKVGHLSWFRVRNDRSDTLHSPYRDPAEDWRTVPFTNEYQLCWLRSGLTRTLHSMAARCREYFSGSSFLLRLIGGLLGMCVEALIAGNVLTSTAQTYPDLQPLYDAARSYLEIPQRINLLNTRVEVSHVVSRASVSPHHHRPGPPRHAPAAQRDRIQPTRRTP